MKIHNLTPLHALFRGKNYHNTFPEWNAVHIAIVSSAIYRHSSDQADSALTELKLAQCWAFLFQHGAGAILSPASLAARDIGITTVHAHYSPLITSTGVHVHRKRSRVSSRSRTSARQRNTAVVTLIAISPSYTLYAFVNLVRLIINEERSNNSIVSNPCSVPMNNRNDVYGLNRCERFNSWVKIECSGGSRVVSRLFYYLSDAMRANARQKVSSTAHKIGSGRDAGVINLVRSLGKGGGFACYGLYRPEISCRRLVSRETLPSRVAMLPRSDKNRVGDKAASWKKGCGERVESGGEGAEGKVGRVSVRERERKLLAAGTYAASFRISKRVHRSSPNSRRPYPLSWSLAIFFAFHTFMQISNAHVYIYPGGENSRGNAKIHPIYRLCLRTSSN